MIYVLVDGKRMQKICDGLYAKKVEDYQKFKANDVLVLPLHWENKVIGKHIKIEDLQNLRIFLPYQNDILPKSNAFYFYMEDENVLMYNAKLTALGILNKMSDMHINLYDLKIDIIGYGKCAKALMLLCDVMQIKYQCIYHKDNENTIYLDANYNASKVLINTAPVCIFDENDQRIKNMEYIIDISSNKCMKKIQGKTATQIIFPGSLPQLYYCESASKLIENFIRREINEE